jgi:cysteinyl-tRNA synthetase
MSDLLFFNTLIRKKQVFKPIKPELVRMYVCGPTVYSEPHIGNARPAIVFDLLYRVLCKKYGKDSVLYVRNITDVDDKIIQRAKELSIANEQLVKDVTDTYHNNLKSLNVLSPNIEPKVTEHINEIIDFISALIEKDYAYEKDGQVFFNISKYKEYGKLSNQNLDALLKGVRIEIAEEKQEAVDFVLWKPDLENGYNSPWGIGRPGWHIECSTMSHKYLGETFDIHGGGVDLVFPHHENEIAQSVCYTDKPMANFWIHNNLIKIDNEKMSKSLGNVLTINSILEKWDGNVIRLAMLSSHYRSEINWNNDLLENTFEKIIKWANVIKDVKETAEPDADFFQDLFDDLNTPKAIAYISALYKKAQAGDIISAQKLLGATEFLGLELKNFYKKHTAASISETQIEKLISERNEHRKDHNFEKADEIRGFLKKEGVELHDQDEITTWSRV